MKNLIRNGLAGLMVAGAAVGGYLTSEYRSSGEDKTNVVEQEVLDIPPQIYDPLLEDYELEVENEFGRLIPSYRDFNNFTDNFEVSASLKRQFQLAHENPERLPADFENFVKDVKYHYRHPNTESFLGMDRIKLEYILGDEEIPKRVAETFNKKLGIDLDIRNPSEKDLAVMYLFSWGVKKGNELKDRNRQNMNDLLNGVDFDTTSVDYVRDLLENGADSESYPHLYRVDNAGNFPEFNNPKTPGTNSPVIIAKGHHDENNDGINQRREFRGVSNYGDPNFKEHDSLVIGVDFENIPGGEVDFRFYNPESKLIVRRQLSAKKGIDPFRKEVLDIVKESGEGIYTSIMIYNDLLLDARQFYLKE